MTRIIIIGNRNYILAGSDTRRFNKVKNEISDGFTKIFSLTDKIYYTFSGQVLIPRAILENYEENRIPKPESFEEFIISFSKLAKIIKNNSSYNVSDNQFCIFGYDEKRDDFRVVLFPFQNNYDPLENEQKFAILGESKYIDASFNKNYEEITKKDFELNKMLNFLRGIQLDAYLKEKELTKNEPHTNTDFKGVALQKENEKIIKIEF